MKHKKVELVKERGRWSAKSKREAVAARAAHRQLPTHGSMCHAVGRRPMREPFRKRGFQ